MEHGKYPDDSLIGRKKKSRRKKHFLPDWMVIKAKSEGIGQNLVSWSNKNFPQRN